VRAARARNARLELLGVDVTDRTVSLAYTAATKRDKVGGRGHRNLTTVIM
jgi:hypothetical protein